VENYCSLECLSASRFYAAQLSEIALHLRTEKVPITLSKDWKPVRLEAQARKDEEKSGEPTKKPSLLAEEIVVKERTDVPPPSSHFVKKSGTAIEGYEPKMKELGKKKSKKQSKKGKIKEKSELESTGDENEPRESKSSSEGVDELLNFEKVALPELSPFGKIYHALDNWCSFRTKGFLKSSALEELGRLSLVDKDEMKKNAKPSEPTEDELFAMAFESQSERRDSSDSTEQLEESIIRVPSFDAQKMHLLLSIIEKRFFFFSFFELLICFFFVFWFAFWKVCHLFVQNYQ
jgi:hypothetical protein